MTQKILFHGHCYDKASPHGTAPMKKFLEQWTTEGVEEIPSGCCGMAGAFGYEEEHHAFSLSIGELTLFPTVRTMPEETALIANGFSCRSQIAFGTGRQPLHIAEWLAGTVGEPK